MSIRLRLALWYGGLAALVLLAFATLAYVLHVRGQYEDLDRALVTSAGHAAAAAVTADGLHLPEGSGGLEVALRLYGPDGRLVEGSTGAGAAPAVDPRAVLERRSDAERAGAFGVLYDGAQRWRFYVLPVIRDGAVAGYAEAATPLGRLDAARGRFRLILLGLGVAGLGVLMLGTWGVAGQALRPVARMIGTARAIADTRGFARRLEVPPRRDELRLLAETFNAMLSSLEDAYRAQQRFVADASHELRAPLTAIQGNLELLRRHPHMPASDREEALAEAEREAGRLARLVADLLALARADAGVRLERRPVDLDAVLLDAFRAARQLAAGQVLDLAPFEPARVLGDEDRLKQLLLILVDNALKYTPAGGRVTLGLRRRGSSAEVVVADTGIGIPAADLPHVFDRFYRADPARSRDPGGTGLGLSIARWIAQQHGGEIVLESAEGRGTRAVVRLPLA